MKPWHSGLAMAALMALSCKSPAGRDDAALKEVDPVTGVDAPSWYDPNMKASWVVGNAKTTKLYASKDCHERFGDGWRLPDPRELTGSLASGLMTSSLAARLQGLGPVWTSHYNSIGVHSYYKVVHLESGSLGSAESQDYVSYLCVRHHAIESWSEGSGSGRSWKIYRPATVWQSASKGCQQKGGRLASVGEINTALANGLADPARNPVFGYIARQLGTAWTSETSSLGARTLAKIASLGDGPSFGTTVDGKDFHPALCVFNQ